MAPRAVSASETLAGLLRASRERALLTQEELARRSGLSVGTIRGLESGRIRRPRSGSVRLLAEALGLTEENRALLVAAARGELVEPIDNRRTHPDVLPAQLPADVAGFAGRTDALTALDELLPVTDAAPVAISVVAGAAGVGKTALAVHWAHRVADQFPDGQLYVNLRGFDPVGHAMEPAEAIRLLLDAFGVPSQRIPADLDAQAGLYRSLLTGRRVLVMLDNARDAEQVRPLLPGATGCLVVVTSRSQLSGLLVAEAARPITLDLLTQAEALQMLGHRLGPDRIAAEPHAVKKIINRCARLPLALAIVAAKAAAHPGFPLEALAAELGETRAGLDAFAGADKASDLRMVFSWSYQAVSDRAGRLFRLLGLHPGPDVTAAAAAGLADRTVAEVRPLLADLAQAHLVTEHTPGRYAFHDLLRAYAVELTHTEDRGIARRAAVNRVLDHYLRTAHTAALLLQPHRDPITPCPVSYEVIPEHLAEEGQAWAWFTAEYPVLVAAIRQAAATGFDTHAWQLAWTLVGYCERQGLWHDQRAVQQVALDAARRSADLPGQAIAYRDLGGAYARLGLMDEAFPHLLRALELFGEANDRTGQARTHLRLAWACYRLGQREEAFRHDQEALELYRATGDRVGQGRALNNIGWMHALVGEYQQAVTCCQQALRLHREVGHRPGQADTWDSLGYAYHHLGRQKKAITCYQHALDLFRQAGDRYFEADTLTHLGDSHHAAGNTDAARDAWQHALTILDELDHPDADQVRTKLDQPDTT